MIPYAKQFITDDDIEAVVKVLKSDFITQGEIVPQFEQAVAHYCQAKFAFAVSHATAALHLACRVLDIGPGDSVWTSPNTFVASANCVLYCGASIDFIDIDPHSYNLSVAKLQEKLILADKAGKLPKAIIAVHFAGQSCEMAMIQALSRQYDFAIIEDAAHAIGASYLDSKVGSCRYSDITIFSFHPVKLITTGEGGMLLTNNPALAEKIHCLRVHGITRESQKMTEASHGDWYYQQIELGYNYRITDIQAALGLSQLNRLDLIVEKREEIARFYNTHLIDLPIVLPQQNKQCISSWHLYVICLQLDKISLSRKQVFDALRAAGIGVQIHYIPVHTQPYYKQLGFSSGDFIQSEQYYEEVISLPIFFSLSREELEYIAKTLRELLSNCQLSPASYHKL